jgi:uncharacterized protein (DUF58 family)
MSFSNSRTTEGEAVGVTLTLINRWPWPLWGLAVVGGFRQLTSCEESHDDLPVETALASVPAWSESTFHWKFIPSRRGCYPTNDSFLTTGFPFGLWQARRLVVIENRLVAWPRRYAMPSTMPDAGVDQTGLGLADTKPGDAGDFLGVRPYRSGDLLKRVHWSQTARHGRLIVCEHQAASRPAIRVIADLHGQVREGTFDQEGLEATIRAAASLCDTLHRQHARVEYSDDKATFCIAPGNHGMESVLDHLASIPYHGPRDITSQNVVRRVDHRHGMLEVVVTADRHLASRQQAHSKTAQRFSIIVAKDLEPVGCQWEAICRDA